MMRLGGEPDRSVTAAVAALVREKRLLDMQMIAVSSHSHGPLPLLDPYAFYTSALPWFPSAPIDLELGLVMAHPDRILDDIDPRLVIGAGWSRWWFDQRGGIRDADRALRVLNELQRITSGGREAEVALLALVYPLGLAIAFEGKNRFEAARQLQVPNLRARVAVVHAPPATSMLLRPLNHGGSALERLDGPVLRSSDKERLSPIIFPGASALLRSYGVRRGASIGGSDEEMLRDVGEARHRELISHRLG